MDMRDILQELGIPTAPDGHHHTSAGRLQIDCPWCSPKTGRWRMGLKESKSWYCHCWTCGSHGTAATLGESANLPVKAVVALLGTLPNFRAFDRKEAGGKLVLPGMRHAKLPKSHRAFLKARGFDYKKICELWRVEAFTMHPRFPWRLYIPITVDGEVVSFTTRSIYDADPVPYLSAKPEEERVCHKNVLYGEEYCTNTIAVVEGPLDVWAIGPGSVCTFGLQYSSSQILKIAKYPRRVIAFDNEPLAQRVAEKLCRDLEVFDGETVRVKFQTGKDASRATRKEVRTFRKLFLQT